MKSHQEAYKRFFSRDTEGNLIFCGLRTPDILNALTDVKRGEPIYIMGTEIVQFQAKAAEEALQASRTRRTYAIKANSNPAVLEIIRQQGIGAEVASAEELLLAINSGFAPKDIAIDGIGKTEEYFRLALEYGVPIINCNDKNELELLNHVAKEMDKRPRVGIRISPDIAAAGETEQISTADDKSKFGVKLADAKRLYLSNDYPHLDLTGIHCHLGSNIRDKAKFEQGFDAIVSLAEELESQGHKLEYIDFGGGVGAPYTPYGALGLEPSEADRSLITVDEFGKILNRQRERLNKINPDLEFVSELGRYYVAPAMMYLCKVTGENVKGEHTHLNTSGSMGHLIRTALYHAPHRVLPMVERENSETYGRNTMAVGTMCESDDVLVLDCEGLQKQKKGDYICIPSTGAYNPTMQLATYNQFGTCGTILVHTDGKAYLTQHPISGREYMMLQSEGGKTPSDLVRGRSDSFVYPTGRNLQKVYDANAAVPGAQIGRRW